jgi:hypothetical protein
MVFVVGVGEAGTTVSTGIVGVGGRGVQVAVDGVIVTRNSDVDSLVSVIRVVCSVSKGGVTHEPTKRKTAMAIVATRIILEDYSCACLKITKSGYTPGFLSITSLQNNWHRIKY